MSDREISNEYIEELFETLDKVNAGWEEKKFYLSCEEHKLELIKTTRKWLNYVGIKN